MTAQPYPHTGPDSYAKREFLKEWWARGRSRRITCSGQCGTSRAISAAQGARYACEFSPPTLFLSLGKFLHFPSPQIFMSAEPGPQVETKPEKDDAPEPEASTDATEEAAATEVVTEAPLDLEETPLPEAPLVEEVPAEAAVGPAVELADEVAAAPAVEALANAVPVPEAEAEEAEAEEAEPTEPADELGAVAAAKESAAVAMVAKVASDPAAEGEPAGPVTEPEAEPAAELAVEPVIEVAELETMLGTEAPEHEGPEPEAPPEPATESTPVPAMEAAPEPTATQDVTEVQSERVTELAGELTEEATCHQLAEAAAATKLQASQRGHTDRAKLAKLRAEPREEAAAPAEVCAKEVESEVTAAGLILPSDDLYMVAGLTTSFETTASSIRATMRAPPLYPHLQKPSPQDSAMLALNDWRMAQRIRTADSESREKQLVLRRRRQERERLESWSDGGRHVLPRLASKPIFPATQARLSSTQARSNADLIDSLLLHSGSMSSSSGRLGGGGSISTRSASTSLAPRFSSSASIRAGTYSTRVVPQKLAPLRDKAEPTVPRMLDVGEGSSMIGFGTHAVSYW